MRILIVILALAFVAPVVAAQQRLGADRVSHLSASAAVRPQRSGAIAVARPSALVAPRFVTAPHAARSAVWKSAAVGAAIGGGLGVAGGLYTASQYHCACSDLEKSSGLVLSYGVLGATVGGLLGALVGFAR